MLGPAIQIERAQPLQIPHRPVVIEAQRTVAIGRRRGGVNEPHLPRRAPAPQPQRQLDIDRPGRVAVGRRGIADRAEVEQHLQRRMGGEEVLELLGRQQSRRRMLGQVAPLAVGAQPVHHNRLVAAGDQRRVQVGADESGAAGDHDHGPGYTGNIEPAAKGETHGRAPTHLRRPGRCRRRRAVRPRRHPRGGRGDGPRQDRRGDPPARPGPARGTGRAGGTGRQRPRRPGSGGDTAAALEARIAALETEPSGDTAKPTPADTTSAAAVGAADGTTNGPTAGPAQWAPRPPANVNLRWQMKLPVQPSRTLLRRGLTAR